MKKILSLCLLALVIAMGNVSEAQAGKKSEMRINYVLKNLGVSSSVQAKLRPLLESYHKDKKTANKEYDALKDKYRISMDSGTLTDKQAQALLDAKWVADQKELVVKKQYEQKFKTVLPVKKVWFCFDLLNDSKSKMSGNKDSDE